MKKFMVGDETFDVVSDFCYLGNMLSADGGCKLASIARCKCAWDKFRQLLPFFTNRHLSLLIGGSIIQLVTYALCYMLLKHGP